MSYRWYVVQIQPHAEERARRHLVNQGFKVYLPRYHRTVRHARRSVSVLRPLFPGYLFVHIDPEVCQWRSINGTAGVCQILTDGIKPRPIAREVVEEIIAREDSTGAVKLPPPVLVRGQRLRLIDGPFADYTGIFEEARDQERVVLLLSLLGRDVRIEAASSALAPAA
jgi:transcriptional antiterminator RfaH